MFEIEQYQIEISESKLKNYLLNENHIDGLHKAKFFRSFGFTIENWQEFKNSLLEHLKQNYKNSILTHSPYGEKYIVTGVLEGIDGRKPTIKSVWFVENDKKILKFVTAYPTKR